MKKALSSFRTPSHRSEKRDDVRNDDSAFNLPFQDAREQETVQKRDESREQKERERKNHFSLSFLIHLKNEVARL